MKKGDYILLDVEQPEIDKLDCRNFEIHFQRAILLSLLENHKLTLPQFEACMDKVVQKFGKS